jgi:hypothetical protein
MHWDGTLLASDEAILSLLIARPDDATLDFVREYVQNFGA